MKYIKRNKIQILVFLIYVLSRLPNLGCDCFNTDVWKWKARSYDFGTGVFTLDFEKTIQKYHPGVTLMWIGSIAVKFNNLFPAQDTLQSIFQLHFIQKLLLTLVIGFCMSVIYRLLSKIIDSEYAFISVILLIFEPFFIGLTRVFHLEGLLSVFMLISILYLYLNNILFAGVFAGLSILTKTSALYLLPFFALAVFMRTKSGKETFIRFLKFFGITLVTMFVLWPILWIKPIYVFSTLYRGISVIGIEREHVQYYFGKLVEDPGVSYYPVVLFLRSSLWLIAGLGGLILGRKYVLKNKKHNNFIGYLSIYSLFYVIELGIPSKKLDRYVLPALVPLVLISSFWVKAILQKVKKRYLKGVIFAAPILLTAFYLHPDYLSYYNPISGGLRTGINILEPKWMIGEKQIISYFENIKKEEGYIDIYESDSMEELIQSNEVENVLTVGFPEKYYTQIWPFLRKINSWAVIKDLTPFAVHTKYFIYPVWADDSVQDDRLKLVFKDQIKIRGVPVYNVYKNSQE